MADSPHLFTLLEVAAGYALFEVVAFEEIGALLSGSMDTVTDLALFSRAVKLKAFQPFASAEEALENANAISEHAMTLMLKTFLEMNLPKVSKKTIIKHEGKAASFSLGITDPGLATAVAEGIPGISCRSDDTIREIQRGCRLHLKHYVKGLDSGAAEQAQLGLGHAYSRGKVKFNPARSDNMIIQSIALLDQMDKDLNTFAMRTREWYSWHFPELKDLVKDNYMFARCAAFIQDKSSLFTSVENNDGEEEDRKMPASTGVDKLPGLIEILGDPDTANAVVNAAKTSMGMACSAVDMINIVNFTQRMIKLAEYRKQLATYLSDKMSIVAPNLSTLIGDTVAARLISKAGSLTNLAKSPASTVQILGAEKALFRALKTKGNTPKYGLIYHSTFIGRANAKNKGRISRYLANKCAIATRIDSFTDEPNHAYGEKLREQVEERLRFYETGAAPRKNLDVMKEVAKTLAAVKDKQEKRKAETMDVDDESPKKKSKKEKRRKSEPSESKDEDVIMKAAPKTEDEKKEKKVESMDNSDKKEGKEKKRKSEPAEPTKVDAIMKESVDSKDEKKEKKAASTPKSTTSKNEDVVMKEAPRTEDSKKEKADKAVLIIDTEKKEGKEKKRKSEPTVSRKEDSVMKESVKTEEVKKDKKAVSTPKGNNQMDAKLDSLSKDDMKSPKSDKKKKKKDKSKE